MPFTAVTVTGAFVRGDGLPASGRVLATPTAALRNGLAMLEPVPVAGEVRAGLLVAVGGGPLVLAATDDAATTPNGGRYSFVVLLDDAPVRAFEAVVPSAAPGGTVDLSALAPSDT